MPPTSKMSRPEVSRVALVFALLAALFLSPALLTGRYLSPADMLLDSHPWREVRPDDWEGPSNSLLVDSAVQFEPWLAYSAKRLREGSLPLWNPDNMLGAPFLGNMQSGIFYPLNWPYFAWPDPWMLVVRAWLKLFIAALGMYVLVREVLRLGSMAAGVAALTFTFGAFMTVWLLHPHTATVIWLPWLWWATARLVERPGARSAALLAAFVGVHMLAGHPETAYHMGQAVALFMLFHAWQTGPRVVNYQLRITNYVRRLIRIGGWWVGAYLLGVLVSAVQLLPFLEYSQVSMALLRREERQMTPFFVPFQYAWTAFSPDLFGNPALKTQWGAPINYNEANNYSGIFPLLLAPFVFLLPDRKQRRLAIFLVIAIILTLGVIHGWPLISDAALLLPGMRLVLNNRLVMLIEFALALLAALGVHGLLAVLPERRRFFVGILGATVTAIVIVGVAVPALFMHSFFAVPRDSELASRVWGEGLWRTALLLILCGGALTLVGLLWKESRRVALALWIIPVILLADLWQAHITYLPTTRPEHYFPQTSLTDFLRDKDEAPFRISASQGIFIPNTNMAYGISDLRGYDAVEAQAYYQLAARGDPSRTQLTTGGFDLSRALDLLNVRYIITAPGDDPRYVADVRQEVNTASVGEIRGESRPGQDFVAQANNLAGIQVLGATYGKQAAGRLVFTLQESTGATLVTQELDASQLPDNSYWNITFSPISGARGRHFYFYFSAPEAQPGQAATLWYNEQDAYPGGTRREGDRAVGGDLSFRTLSAVSFGNPRFRPMRSGYFSAGVYENQRVLPRAWLTYGVEVQQDAGERIQRLYDPTFYIGGVALLSEPLPASSVLPGSQVSASDSATITRYEPEYVEVKTVSGSASLLVLSDLAYPGWGVEVDGRASPIQTADHALRAVYLPAGEHIVKFVYRPLSFTLGAIISILSVVAIGLVGWPRRNRGSGVVSVTTPS